MLRSFAYAASASELLHGRPAPEGWEQRAREDFLNGLPARPSSHRCCHRAPPATETLLQIFELEKAVYELRYELNNRPDWVRIPVAGIARLLEGGHRDMSPEDLARLVARDHPNPHAVLGAHPQNGDVVIRAFRPSAETVVALPSGTPLTPIHPAGVFEGVVEGAELPLDYRLEVTYGEGSLLHAGGPLPLRPHRHRPRRAPGSARAVTSSCGPSSARTCAISTA